MLVTPLRLRLRFVTSMVNQFTQDFGLDSALCVNETSWHDVFEQLLQQRRELKEDYGIYVRKELHAGEFVAGRGKISNITLPKGLRCALFKRLLKQFTDFGHKLNSHTLPHNIVLPHKPSIFLINASLSKRGRKHPSDDTLLRIVQRIENTVERYNDRAILIFDKGNEAATIKTIRRLRRFNPIPSMFGRWSNGTFWKNIPLTHIIEDPFFKDSRHSFFIQIVDWCAYSLLRFDVPTDRAKLYAIDRTFPILEPILYRLASYNDRYGVVRK